MNHRFCLPLARILVVLFTLITGAVRGGPLDARLDKDAVTLREGGRVRTFVIARDEVGVIAPGGRGRVQKVAQTADAEAVRVRARQPDVAAGGRADLVLYEQGQPKTEAHRRWLTSRVLAKVRAGADAQVIATAVGAASSERPAFAPGYVLFTAPAGAGNGLTLASALRLRPEIESAEPQLARLMTKRFIPNDPFFADNAANAGYQWHLRNTGDRGGIAGIDVNVTTAWDTAKGAGVRIGILDDGLELTHPDLAAHVDAVNSFDYNGNDADPTPEAGDDHGTAVAGVAGAIGNNGLGVSGAAPEATLVGLRLVSGPSTDADEAAAFARRNDIIQIKSNSWGPDDFGDVIEGPGLLATASIQDAIANGRAGKGTLFFWAAGNGGTDDNSNFDGYANSVFTLAIAALGDDGFQSDYSESGANILVAAPSDSVDLQGISTVDRSGSVGYNAGGAPNYPSGDFTNDFGGTSSACPLAAGVGALVLQTRPSLTWRDVKEILIRTAKKNDPADADWDVNPILAGVQDNGAGLHFNHKYGAGLVDAAAAVALAQTWTLLPPMSTMQKSNAIIGSIPDFNAGGIARTFAFTAAEFLRVESVAVTVGITHSNRGDLEVELTSPSGTVSRLAELRPNDAGADLQWTFTSVHHWGESAVGTWSVVVKDRVTGSTGTLDSVALTLYGSGALVTGIPVITSAGTAGGTQSDPFSYQITATQSPTSFGATGLPAWLSVNNVTGILSGTPTVAGVYNVTVTAANALGTGTLPLTITITLGRAAQIAEAVDQPTLPFDAPLPDPWFAQTVVTHDGSDAAQSGPITDDGSSTFSVDVTGPVAFRFWWKVSSEADYDFFSVLVDGLVQVQISGEVGWQQRTIAIPDGVHTVTWSYAKDSGGSEGLDAGFVDQVSLFPFNLSPPLFTLQPRPLIVGAGGTAAFCVETESPLPVTYQWLRNGAVIAGATSRCYVIAAAAVANAGQISCRATNANGASDSDAVTLTVNAASPASAALGNAVDNTTLIWTTSGSTPVWARTTALAQTHDGADAARAAGVAVNTSTTLSTTVMGPGTVSFWWRCDGEADYDYLDFNVDGENYDFLTGGDPYVQVTYSIPSGLHSLEWTYSEDQEGAANIGGRGLVDQVTFTPSAFGTWQAANFTLQQRADAFASGPDADPNRDGTSNLQAYALGIHPLTGFGAPQPRAAETPSGRALIYRRNTAATDVNFFVQQTTDLADEFSWSDVSTSDTILSTVGTLETIEAVVPETPNLNDFYRLRLELVE